MFDFNNARFGNIHRNETTAIIGTMNASADEVIVLYDLNRIMAAAEYSLSLKTVPLPFALLTDADRSSLANALNQAEQHGEMLNPLWKQVLADCTDAAGT